MTDAKDSSSARHCSSEADSPLGLEPDARSSQENEGDSGHLSRRQVLAAASVATGAVVFPRWFGTPALADVALPSTLTGTSPLKVAMHLHGSWSEGYASWHTHFAQAAANRFDVLYMTDHDTRQQAFGYATSLSGLPWDISATGTLAQKAATSDNGSFHLLAESSSSTSAASLTMQVREVNARNKLRTSIAGTTITQRTTSAVLTNGASYEIVVPLSYHPASAGRPAGFYKLVYRFGGPAGRWTEGGGLTGVVRAPRPAAGSTQVLTPAKDVAAIWPDLVAVDNCFYGLSFVARSPKRAAVADVRVRSVTFTRTQTSAASVITNQATIVSAYRARYPSVIAYPQTEISKYLPDMNTFGMAQWLPDYSKFSTVHDTLHLQLLSRIHELGGIVSYNHPFGYDTNPLLSASEQAVKRRQVFTSMNAVHAFGADILEVGYAIRGQVDAATHIALWDTFSRNGTFLTGNGVTDDHGGRNWKGLVNGFFTGIWASLPSDAALAGALRSGRAYTAHLGKYPGGAIDMLVDGTIPMGAVSVSPMTSRQLALYVANIPSGGIVELVAGPVDYAGNVDPGTSVVRSFTASAFADGLVTVPVSTSSDRFYRAQVRSSTGEIIGTGNPVWLLRRAPPPASGGRYMEWHRRRAVT